MAYNDDAQVFEKQIVIENTSQEAGVTSGSIINKGTLSTLDTYITGHTIVNNVKITPNLNDIIFEQQSTLANNQASFTNISGFSFDNSTTTSFKAIINVTVSAGQAKYAVWEINGLYKPSGWVITSSFTGDLTGIDFSIANEGGIGHVQYKNSNTSGTTTIRYRASTTAPPGSTPIGVSGGVITNTSGPFIANNLIYASTNKTLATTDITYNSNLFTIGGSSRFVGENATSFVNFSNGGAITSMGDASVAKHMIIGEKVGIATTAPSYALDIVGDINFTGTFYKNKSIYSGSEIWNTNGTNVFYTTGNIGLGTTNPSHQLDVAGGIRSTSLSSGSISTTNIIATNSTIGTFAALGGTIGGNVIPSVDITYSLGSATNRWKDLWLASGTLYLGDKPLSLTGDTFTLEKISVTSTVDSSSVTTGALLVSGGAGINGKIYSTEIHSSSGTVGSLRTSTVDASTITAASIQVTNVNATTVTASTLLNTNAVSTNVTAATLNLTTGLTSASALITDVVATNISTGTLQAPSGITVGNINFTGSLYQNGVPYLGSQWTSTAGNVSYTSGSVSAINIDTTTVTASTILANIITAGTISLSGDLIVGGTLTTVNITTTNLTDVNISTGTLNASSSTISNVLFTNISSSTLIGSDANITTLTAGTLRLTSTNIALGSSAGNISQSVWGIAIGRNAGNTSQGSSAIAIGAQAGQTLQGVQAVAIGNNTGITSQGSSSVAIGPNCATNSQGASSVAVGTNSGNRQGTYATAIGPLAGSVSQGNYAVAIGTEAGRTSQHANSIVINANSSQLNSATAGAFYVSSVRNVTQANLLAYDTTLKEITYFSLSNFTTSNLVASNISTGTLNLSTGLTSLSAQITNAQITTLTAGNVVATDITSGSILATTIVGSTSVSSGLLAATNVTATNVVATDITSGSILATTIVGSTSVSSGLLAATNVTATNVVATTLTAGSIIATTIVGSTSVSSGLLAATNVTATNVVATTLTAGSIIATTIVGSTSVSSGLLAATNVTATNVVATTLTTGALKTSDISLDGNLVATGDITAFGSLSDRRLKTNIIDIDSESALNTVKSLRPVTFDWRDDIFNESKRGSHDVGFIAQEVEEVVPQAVAEYKEMNSGTFYKNIKHERLIPYLVGAIQKLQLRIEELEKKV